MTSFADRRLLMVDTQVRPSDVTKFPIIDAMLSVPRELYVPAARKEAAYMGGNLEIEDGRVLLEPRTLAKMLDALDVQADELVLDIAAAYGYSSALLANLAQAVVALEENEAMADEAQETLLAQGIDNVAVVTAPLAEGADQHGPYDVILIQGAIEHLPAAISDQLKDGGRIACIFQEGALGVVRIGHKARGTISWRYSFNAGAPILQGFAKENAFAL